LREIGRGRRGKENDSEWLILKYIPPVLKMVQENALEAVE
jgi:hypothetical protein